jgi:putative lipoic acid-binding regulatory protein
MNPKQTDPNKETLLEFPCRFPIKAMGRSAPGFEAIVVQIMRKHAELWQGEERPVSSNPSSAGKYTAVTVVIEATSREQLDAIYQDLTDCPDVLMAL